jgi:hypothetical protein
MITALVLAVVAMVTLPGRHRAGAAADDPGQSGSRT